MSAEQQVLAPDDLRRICEVVYRRSGMTYGESKRYFIERRVSDCMVRANCDSVAAYMTLLRWNDGEVERLINSFTVNETYFYREEHQLRCLGASLLPEIVGGRRPGPSHARPARSPIRSRCGSWKTGVSSTPTTSRSSAPTSTATR